MSENEVSFPGRSSLNVYGGGLAAVHSMGAIKFVFPRSKINFIEGVSAGALITSILISNDFNVEKLIEIWLTIDNLGAKSIFKTNNLGGFRHVSGPAWYDNDGIKEVINKYVNVEKIMAWEGEFIVIANNITRGKKIPFSNKDESMQKNPELMKSAILASSSMGGLLPPVLIEGEWYRDGLSCSLVASIDRDMDNIFVVLSHKLNEGAEEHQENDFWGRQFIHTLREAVRDSVIKDLKYAKKLGYKLIEQNPTDFFDDVEASKQTHLKNLIKDTVNAINPLNPESIDERTIAQRKAIVFTPENPVSTLKTDEFRKGDIKMAIERSMKEIEVFAEKLAKQL